VTDLSRQTTEAPAIENRVDLGTFKETALDTPAGKSSPYRSSRDGGFVVYVSKVIPPSEERIQKDFPKFVEDYRDEQQNVAYTEWFQHELMKSGLMAPKPAAKATK
jgi:hypothetical protein